MRRLCAGQIRRISSVLRSQSTFIAGDRFVFKSLGNLANIGTLMKQAQEMSGRMQALQEQLKTKRATGAAGGGLIEVEVNGLGEALAVRIDPSLVEKGEREMIEDLLPAAINAAQTKAKQMHAEAMQSIAGELPIAGLSDAIMQLGGGSEGPST